jgi:hypothetical protein
LLFGAKKGIAPARVDRNGAAHGITAIDAVYSHTDETPARSADVTTRTVLVVGVDYTVDLAGGPMAVRYRATHSGSSTIAISLM